MRSNNNVNFSFLKFWKYLLLPGRLFMTGQVFDIAWKTFQPWWKCFVMLKCKNSSRHKNCCLLAVRSWFECSPYSYFGFPEPDIAADKPVHGMRRLHIFLHWLGCWKLIRGIFIKEWSLKFTLQVRIRRKWIPVRGHSFCIELYQVPGNILYPAFCILLHLLPGSRTKLVYLRFRIVLPFIFWYAVKRMNADIQDVIIPVNQFYCLLYLSVHLNFFEPAEPAYPMVNMDYIISRVETC